MTEETFVINAEMLITTIQFIFEELKGDQDFEKAVDKLKEIKLTKVVDTLNEKEEPYTDLEKILIPQIIRILQYVYSNSGVIPPVGDEPYDTLYEINKMENGEEIIGSSFNTSDKNITMHTYPELRGTLDKIHFIRNSDKGKDKRKSYQDWKKTVENRLGRKISDDETIWLFPKWDGLSGIGECDDDGLIEKMLSRGDTEKNEALDLTPMFKGANFKGIVSDKIKAKFGIKTEMIMSRKNYQKLCELEGDFKSPRSTISSILNSAVLDLKYRKYITAIPLQAQLFGEHEIFIPSQTMTDYPYAISKIGDLDDIEEKIKQLKKTVDKDYGYDIDGIVIRIVNTDLQKQLGRENNINKYEVAYKFPPEEKKSVLKDVIFSIGILGKVTPVAKIEPVVMKGNTIKSISLGSIDIFESLDLRVGSEVIIKYDVIPYLTLDDTCKKGVGDRLEAIKNCPYCGKPIVSDPTPRCANDECISRQKGKILNYIRKMRIPFMAVATIDTFFDENILMCIEDIYKLKNKKSVIVELDGFGKRSFEKIIQGIDSRRKVFNYELLGSLGIKSIGRKIFKKILTKITVSELIDICQSNKIKSLIKIEGIKEKSAQKIIDGINGNLNLIRFLQNELRVKSDDKEYVLTVYFTKIRDNNFADFLDSKNVYVSENYNKSVNILIVKDENTDGNKVDAMKESIANGKDGKIMTIDEAYRFFKYK